MTGWFDVCGGSARPSRREPDEGQAVEGALGALERHTDGLTRPLRQSRSPAPKSSVDLPTRTCSAVRRARTPGGPVRCRRRTRPTFLADSPASPAKPLTLSEELPRPPARALSPSRPSLLGCPAGSDSRRAGWRLRRTRSALPAGSFSLSRKANRPLRRDPSASLPGLPGRVLRAQASGRPVRRRQRTRSTFPMNSPERSGEAPRPPPRALSPSRPSLLGCPAGSGFPRTPSVSRAGA